MKTFRGAVVLLLLAVLGGCGGGGGDDGNNGNAGAPALPVFHVGGTVSGLAGSGLVLQNNHGDNLAIAADGSFTFPAAVTDGGEYAVTVYAQPAANPVKTCSLVRGSGKVRGADVSDVEVLCRAPWTKQHGSAGGDFATGIARDTSGNLLVAGYTTGTMDGITGAGGYDAFLTKYDAAGARLWTRQFGSADFDFVEGVATDAAGNAYVTGFSNAVLPGEVHAGRFDAFLASFDTDGNLRWVREFGTAENDYAWAVATDPNNDIVVTGKAYADIAGAGLSCGSGCQFLAKFDAAGNQLWLTGFEYFFANAIATDSHGDVYLAGNTFFNLDPATNSLFTLDIAVLKYAGDGTALWARMIGTTGSDDVNGIAVDAADNVIVAGYTTSNLPGAVDDGGSDVVIAKYDANGVKKWQRQIGAAHSEEARAVTTDSAGNVYVSGWTESNFDGNSNAGTGGSTDLFLLKLDSGGDKLWSRELGTSGDETGTGVVVNADGNIVVTGYTDRALDGNTGAGNDDYFLVRYDSDGVKQ